MRFWDSSAIVPLLVEERVSPSLLALLDADPVMAVWWGTPVECVSAIARREREGHLEPADATRAISRLRILAGAWNEVVASEPVRQAATRLLRVHPLRAADGLQLAAAVVAADGSPGTLAFVCQDDRLGVAAEREGFTLVAGSAFE